MPLSLEYQIKAPKIILEKNPVLVLLHGYGSNEKDLFSFAPELPEKYYVVSVRAPYEIQYESYAWYAINFDAEQNKFSDKKQAIRSRDLIMQFLEELLLKYPIDSNEISLVGFSQGAILSYAIALSNPDKIKQIVAMSGYLDLDIIAEDYLKNNLNSLRIFASHGTVDQVIPIEWARKTTPFLTKLGVAITYKEYPIGHGVSPQNFYDFKNWLF